MAEHPDRTGHYRLLANRLRALATAAQLPEVRAELLWLAHSYDRLADAELSRIEDGFRVLGTLESLPAKNLGQIEEA
ncbi:MAG TPA: hypothetical protein VLC74_11640 [Rhizomicrobium sp.]|nr:hypothetical protein [Rhizomicrobium sp.]